MELFDDNSSGELARRSFRIAEIFLRHEHQRLAQLRQQGPGDRDDSDDRDDRDDSDDLDEREASEASAPDTGAADDD